MLSKHRFLQRLAWAPLAAAALASPAPADRLGDHLEALRLCQLPHLTAEGWFAAAPSRFYVDRWTPELVEALAREARERPPRTDRRDSRRLQTTVASAYQAAAAYETLAARMRAAGVAAIDRGALFARAEAAYARRLAAGGFAPCVKIKWGNRYPDIVLQPLPRAAWQGIVGLFERGRLDWPATAEERALLRAGTLTPEELSELRALRVGIALFERRFALLREDEGGWEGNLSSEPFVCTDEATTTSFLVDRLEAAGALTRFRQHAGRFAHRSPTPILPDDHYAVMLRNERTGDYWVVDSWAEDGGAPPAVDTLQRFMESRARPGLISIGDPALDAALAAGEITHDRPAAMRRLGAWLAELAPAAAAAPAVPDGTPAACENGFHFCVPPDDLDAWGPRLSPR